jgi:hypothetical protein
MSIHKYKPFLNLLGITFFLQDKFLKPACEYISVSTMCLSQVCSW